MGWWIKIPKLIGTFRFVFTFQITSAPLEDDEINQERNNDEDYDEENNELINEQDSDQNHEQNRQQNKRADDKINSKKRKRSSENPDTDIHKNIRDAVCNLNSVLLNRKENDECDLHTQLLATRLREYPDGQRRQIMHGIDGFLLANPPQQLQHHQPYFRSTPSPVYSFSSSSNSSITARDRYPSRNTYVPQQFPTQGSIPDRPSSHNNYALQPQQFPVQISIPDRPSPQNCTYSYGIASPPATSSKSVPVGPVLPIQNRVTASQSILNEAHVDAIYEENYNNV